MCGTNPALPLFCSRFAASATKKEGAQLGSLGLTFELQFGGQNRRHSRLRAPDNGWVSVANLGEREAPSTRAFRQPIGDHG